MPVIATDQKRISAVVKHEYAPSAAYTRDVITVNVATAGTLPVGTVLGKVTATGKYKVQDASASDGSEIAAAVLIGKDDVDAYLVVAANTDTKALAWTRGPLILDKQQLTMGPGTDTDAEKQAVYDSLAALGITLADQV